MAKHSGVEFYAMRDNWENNLETCLNNEELGSHQSQEVLDHASIPGLLVMYSHV